MPNNMHVLHFLFSKIHPKNLPTVVFFAENIVDFVSNFAEKKTKQTANVLVVFAFPV